jgi:hypothetical protein
MTGYYIKAPSGLTLKNSTFCPNSVFMCSVWISGQTAIISLYSSNWFVYITDMESVYCAVRAGSLNRIRLFSSFGLAMAQAVVRRPLPVKAQLLSRVSPYAICGSQRGTGADFSPNTAFGFFRSMSCHAPYSFSTTCCSFQKEDKWTKPGKLPTSNGQKRTLIIFRV